MSDLTAKILERAKSQFNGDTHVFPDARPLITTLLEVVEMQRNAMKPSIIIESNCDECGTFSAVKYEIKELKECLTLCEKKLRELAE